ncbi:type VII secretion protein EssB [Metabacillus litoralis]|uniref:type VII secretion protein EssB n=1 Tax=Metabacillus TaxID=2675233 RepID=UPI001B98C4A0|nr:type VII secretion protein EssB [Metabacillus litoralis]UHA58409.1 type VII secretion protein EssB [Metabacillus litoralis]
MAENELSYIEEKLEATIKKEKNIVTFSFQKEKVKLDSLEEISFLEQIEKQFNKKVTMTDDQVVIDYRLPDSYLSISSFLKLEERDRTVTAYQLVGKVKEHDLLRTHLVVCPDNLVFDQGLTPYFLHYGVMESIPPYEKNEEVQLLETKATVAALLDNDYSFEEYFHYYKTLNLSKLAQLILQATDYDHLLKVIQSHRKKLKEKESTLIRISKRKWKWSRSVFWTVCVCFVPVLIYLIYSLFFLHPRQSNVIEAQEHYLNKRYSQVVTTLESYEIDQLPNVAQFELAISYIVNESLTEEQKDYVENTVTLQSDPLYYKYWIHIGRGEADKALDAARFLEDRDIIIYGLIKYREQIKADEEIENEERQQKISEIEQELDAFMKEIEEENNQQDEADVQSNAETEQNAETSTQNNVQTDTAQEKTEESQTEQSNVQNEVTGQEEKTEKKTPESN